MTRGSGRSATGPKLAAASTAVSVIASLAATYGLRAWQRRWLATPGEAAVTLAGDDAVPEPTGQITRAVTIDATPEVIWPWLVQLGADRGGFYSYDWLENLFGLQVHSADSVVQEWQQLRVGDIVYAIRNRTAGWYVVELIPGEVLVLQVADLKAGRPIRRSDRFGLEFLWTFALRPDGSGRTRLLVRERLAFGSRRIKLIMAVVEVISFVMTRRMMIGIKRRAES